MKPLKQYSFPLVLRLIPVFSLVAMVYVAYTHFRKMFEFGDQYSSKILEILSIYFLLVAGMHVWASQMIEYIPNQRRLCRTFNFLGLPIFKINYDLSAFDRISLHRFQNGIFRVTLIGSRKEILLGSTISMGSARDIAEAFSQATSLPVRDLL